MRLMLEMDYIAYHEFSDIEIVQFLAAQFSKLLFMTTLSKHIEY